MNTKILNVIILILLVTIGVFFCLKVNSNNILDKKWDDTEIPKAEISSEEPKKEELKEEPEVQNPEEIKKEDQTPRSRRHRIRL